MNAIKAKEDTHKIKHTSQKYLRLQQPDQKLMIFARQGNKSVILQKTNYFFE